MSILRAHSAGPRLANRYDRYARYRTMRKRRRLLGLAWAVIGAVTLIGAWDVASRMDEVTYTASSIR
jgi:hypothetical protein